MKAQDIDRIDDVLTLAGILDNYGTGRSASVIAALIEWRDDIGPGEVIATVVDKPKTKRGKASTPHTEMDDSVQDDSWPTSVTSGTDDEPDF